MENRRIDVETGSPADPDAPVAAAEIRMAHKASGRMHEGGARYPEPRLIEDPNTPLHVTLGSMGWSLAFEGSDDFVALFSTKKEAMKEARTLARKHDVPLVEHAADGRVV